jgi:molybdate transport system substrate-binding protein
MSPKMAYVMLPEIEIPIFAWLKSGPPPPIRPNVVSIHCPPVGGASGIYVTSLLERLGIAVEMKPKTKLFPPTEVLYGSVASGEVEIGFNQISEILAQPTVELAGPLPSAIQNYTQFAPGIVSGSSQIDAARALVTFLSLPATQTVLKAKGFE